MKFRKSFATGSLSILFLFMVSTLTANPLTNNLEIPFFIKIYILSLGFHHASMMAFVWEITRVSKSKVWDNIFNANIFGILITFTLASLSYNLYINSSFGHYILYISIVLDIVAHIFADLTTYYLVKPIIKEKLSLLRHRYLAFYVSFTGFLYILITNSLSIKFPTVLTFIPLHLLGLFFVLIIFYFVYSPLTISEAYAKVGFVRKPFLLAGLGAILFVSSVGLVLYFAINFIVIEMQHELFYNISFYILSSIFSLIFFVKFIIEYPSLLERKWKALVPFDLFKVALALTLAFLATSLFFTVKESPKFVIYQDVYYSPLIIALSAVLLIVALIFAYTKIITQNSELSYWNYLRAGLIIHLITTFYVFSLIALLWSGMDSQTKLVASIFWLLAFLFYLFYVLDLRTVIKDLGLPLSHSALSIFRYLISLYSVFFLVFLGISFAYGKNITLGTSLESSPVILFFIAIFLLAFTTYLSVTHKGLEELLKKNVWSELSYLTSFAAFVVVYFFYRSMDLQRFPLRDLFFVGYFMTLAIEIFSTRTLGIESKYQKRKETIQDLLNYHTGAWLRADYLIRLWEGVLDKYGALSEGFIRVRFDPSNRGFDLNRLEERVKVTVTVAMLLEMYKREDLNKVTVSGATSESIKEEIEDVLKDKILLLPEELRTQFEEEKYYSPLFESTINNLAARIMTFLPSSEYWALLTHLAKASPVFKVAKLSPTKIEIPRDVKLSRKEFVENFKFYVQSLEEIFPFRHKLLLEPIRNLIKEELTAYGFSVEDLLDLVPTGIETLDSSEGGFVKKTSTLLLSGDTRDKERFLLSFSRQGAFDKDRVIFMSSKQPSEAICNALLKDLDSLDGMNMIDLYRDINTPDSIKEVTVEGNIVVLPMNFTLIRHEVVKAIKKQPKEIHKRVVVDALNDLIRYYGFPQLSSVMLKWLEGFRKWNCTSIFALTPILLKKEELTELERKFDNVIELVDTGSGVRIKKLYGATINSV